MIDGKIPSVSSMLYAYVCVLCSVPCAMRLHLRECPCVCVCVMEIVRLPKPNLSKPDIP